MYNDHGLTAKKTCSRILLYDLIVVYFLIL